MNLRPARKLYSSVAFALTACAFPLVLEADIAVPDMQARLAEALASQTKEVDAIIADMVGKFHSLAPAKDFDVLLKRLSSISVSPYGARAGVSGDEQLLTTKVIGARSFITNWQDYLIQRDLGNSQSANNSLRQIIQMSAEFTAVPRSELIGLETHSPVPDKGAEKTAEAKDRIDKLIAQVVNVIENAAAPGDLDKIAAEIGTMPTANGTTYPRDEDYSKRLLNIRNFVQSYQDYLAAIQSGRKLDAQRDLQGLSNPNYDASFFPRSKILALMDASPKVAEPTLSLLKPDSLSLDRLDEFISQLVALRNNPAFQARNETGLEPAANAVRQRLELVKSGKPGVATSSVNGEPYNGIGVYESVFARMDTQLDMMAAPLNIGAPPDLQPAAQETISAYLDRVLTAAITRKDWILALHTAVYRRDIGDRAGNREDNYNDTQALYTFSRAINFEKAGQWVDAVIAFTNVLDFPCSHVPVDEVSAHLAKIKASNPADYDTAKAALLRRYTDGQVIIPKVTNKQLTPGAGVGSPRVSINPTTGQLQTN